MLFLGGLGAGFVAGVLGGSWALAVFMGGSLLWKGLQTKEGSRTA